MLQKIIRDMKLLRFELDGRAHNGVVEDDAVIDERTKKEYPLDEIEFLPPVNPPKIICMGFNYPKHRKEMDDIATSKPTLTLKSPTSVIGHKQKIILPEIPSGVEHEAELGVVIKKPGYNIENPLEHILGYTIVNDVTARDLEREMIQWSASKSFPTFCPTGPWIETDINPGNLNIKCTVNGELRQNCGTKEMTHSPEECVSFASKFMKLQTGDLIATGTPPGVGILVSGDVVEIGIEKIGVLRNRVA